MKRKNQPLWLVPLLLCLGAAPPRLPIQRTIGNPEPVAYFNGPMPTGVAVSRQRRVFVCFPRWGDPVSSTVVELKGEKSLPFPDASINRFDRERPGDSLISVQSVVMDPADRLWLLDTGSLNFGVAIPGGPKLIGIDLKSNKIVSKILFPPTIAFPTSYLNDVRFDLRRGEAGMAFITDSSNRGPNGIIVVDLASGRSWRRLNDHFSTKAVPEFLPFVEGRPLMNRPTGEPATYLSVGADGIAISNDGTTLYYCPLASRHLYSVSLDALANESLTDTQVAATVMDLGEKPASDGLDSDNRGRIYATAYEHGGIVRRKQDGSYETLVYHPSIIWPDTLSLAADGYLYFTNNQLNRQKQFNNGRDLREKPYSLMRIKVDAKPVSMR